MLVTSPEGLSLYDRIVTIASELGFHGFGVFDIAEWSALNVKQLVSGVAGNENWVRLPAKCTYESVSVFLFGNGGNLDRVRAGSRSNGSVINFWRRRVGRSCRTLR
jgi:hypothetical protein